MKANGILTAKQARFCDEYLIDLNATQAAKRAGYSEHTAYSQGQRLLKVVEIASRIEELQSEAAERPPGRGFQEPPPPASHDRAKGNHRCKTSDIDRWQSGNRSKSND